jgi:type III secretion protein J
MRRLLRLGLLVGALAGCTVPVQHGLDEASANEVVTALERAGIGAEKAHAEGPSTGAGPSFSVEVSGADVARALEHLRAVGLPRGQRKGLAETYAQPSLVPSATEDRARYVEALGNEIERTLETVDGVVSARVHLVLAESDPFASDAKVRVPAQAAVLLKIRTDAVTPLGEADVQRLVAGSVPGLAPAGVAVVVTKAPEAAPGGEAALVALGPLRVSPGSRATLIAGAGALLAVVAGLAMLLLMQTRKVAAARLGPRGPA